MIIGGRICFIYKLLSTSKTWYKHIFTTFWFLKKENYFFYHSLVWNSYLVFVSRYAIPLNFTNCYDSITQENQIWIDFKCFAHNWIHIINCNNYLHLWFSSRSSWDEQRVNTKFIFHNPINFSIFTYSEYHYKEWTNLLYRKPWPNASVYFIGLAFGYKIHKIRPKILSNVNFFLYYLTL